MPGTAWTRRAPFDHDQSRLVAARNRPSGSETRTTYRLDRVSREDADRGVERHHPYRVLERAGPSDDRPEAAEPKHRHRGAASRVRNAPPSTISTWSVPTGRRGSSGGQNVNKPSVVRMGVTGRESVGLNIRFAVSEPTTGRSRTRRGPPSRRASRTRGRRAATARRLSPTPRPPAAAEWSWGGLGQSHRGA